MYLRFVYARARRIADMVASVPELTKRTFCMCGKAEITSSARSASAGVEAPKLVPLRAAAITASTTVGAACPRLPRLRLGNVLSQLRHYAIAPLGGFDLAADVLAYLPVEIDQRGIDGLKCPLPSGCNEADYLGKARLIRYVSLG